MNRRSVVVAIWLVALAVAATSTSLDTCWAKVKSFVKAQAQHVMRSAPYAWALHTYRRWSTSYNNAPGIHKETGVDEKETMSSSSRKAEYEAAKEKASQQAAELEAQMRH